MVGKIQSKTRAGKVDSASKIVGRFFGSKPFAHSSVQLNTSKKFPWLLHNRLVCSDVEIVFFANVRCGGLFVDDAPNGSLELRPNTSG